MRMRKISEKLQTLLQAVASNRARLTLVDVVAKAV
jgi:hypothetical protein